VRAFACAAALFGSCALNPQSQELFPHEGKPAGWSLTAWSDLAESAPDGTDWRVVDGELLAAGARGSWLISEQSYADFELEFEFLLTMLGNSGVALRAPPAGDPAFDGLELQLVDLRYRPEALPSELTGGLYRALAPEQQLYQPERWNRCRIRAVGAHLQVWLNGSPVLDADLDAQAATVPRHDGSAASPLRERPRAGRIGFQHLSRDGAARFRGLRLRELRAPSAEERLAEARAAWLIHPEREDFTVWYGRRMAYLGRYEEAIGIYTAGLQQHPDSIALLRHRGHRFISLRHFGDAIADLERASELARGRQDEVEADGMPNAAGIPRSTLHGNVEYHLALALLLQGRLHEAELAWRRALVLSTNDDTLCAVLAWLHLSLREQGKVAFEVFLPQPRLEQMEILENFAYHELLLYDAGRVTAAELMRGHPAGSVEHATRAYGLAARLILSGDESTGLRMLEEVVAADAAAAFGTIAAEVLLRRLEPSPRD